jgi:hypothetical protein
MRRGLYEALGVCFFGSLVTWVPVALFPLQPSPQLFGRLAEIGAALLIDDSEPSTADE